MIKILKNQYIYFYRKVFSKRPSFSIKDEKFIKSFSKILEDKYGESVSEDWIFEFLSFNFDKFSTAETKMKLQINWIFGKKSLSNYINRHDEADYFTGQFREKYNIKRGDILSKSKISLSIHYKSTERSRFKDPFRRLLHCSELMLFDKDSADCKFCNVKNKCYSK